MKLGKAIKEGMRTGDFVPGRLTIHKDHLKACLWSRCPEDKTR